MTGFGGERGPVRRARHRPGAILRLRLTPFGVQRPGEPEPCGPPVTDWRAAVSAALSGDAPSSQGPAGSGTVAFAVDDRLSMAAVMEGELAWLDDDGLQAAARAWFAHRLGPTDALAVRAVAQPDGRSAVACALPAAMVDGVLAAVAERGVRLVTLRPAWVSALALAERTPAPSTGSGPELVVGAGTSPGVNALGLRHRGVWKALALEPGDAAAQPAMAAAMALLRRETAFGRLAAAEADRASGRWVCDGTAPPGWQALSAASGDALSIPPRGPFDLARLDLAAGAMAPPARAGQAMALGGSLLLGAALLFAVAVEQDRGALLRAEARLTASLPAQAPPPRPWPAPPADLRAVQSALARPLLPALDELAALRTPGIALTRVEPRSDDGSDGLRLKVAAQAPSAAAAVAWLRQLAAAPDHAAVRLQHLEPDVGSTGVRLELELLRRGP